MSSFWSRRWVRTLAPLLSLALLWPQLAWAFEPGLWAKPKAFSGAVQTFSIPAQLAQVTQNAAASQPRLIIIQDLHCQFETQAKIADLLNYLRRAYDVSLILVEGASQAVNVTKLSTFPAPEVRQAAGQYLMRQGKMSGAEYYAATAGQAMLLEGMEKADLYQAERVCLKQFYTFEAQSLAEELQEELDKLKPEIYSPALLALDHYRTGFSAETLSLLQYAHALSTCAQNTHQAFPDIPELIQYLHQNQAKGGEDTDFELLTRQALQWDRHLRAGAYRDEAERKLDETLRRFSQIKACLNLAATFSDISEIRRNPADYRLNEFAHFLAGYGRAQDFHDLEILENYFQVALHFYDLADQRSLAFAQNAREALQRHSAANAVLIAGGYHTELLGQQLQKYGLAFCSIKIRRASWETENPYAARLNDPHCLLEKVLVPPHPLHLALPPFCAQTTDPGKILEAQALTEDTVRSYDFLEGLLKSLAIANVFSFQHPSLETLSQKYAELLPAYPADSKRLDLDFEHARTFSQAVLIPLRQAHASGFQPFIVIYSQASRVPLPSPISQLSIHGNCLGFYPAPMRAGVEKALEAYRWEKAWKIAAWRLPILVRQGLGGPRAAWQIFYRLMRRAGSLLKKPVWLRLPTQASLGLQGQKPAESRTGQSQHRAEGKTTVLPVLTELLNDLKLAAGLIPILQRLSTHPPSWTWTAVSFGSLLAFLTLGSVFSNWLLAQKQNRAFSLREIFQVMRKEWHDYKQNWMKLLKDFWENRRFQPKASWFALALLVAARAFDYGTQIFKLSRLPMILAYSGLGMALIVLGMLAMRSQRKTAWYAEVISQSLRILGAVVVVQVLKLPFAFAMLAFGASQVFADRINDAFLKWLKKVIGVLSFAELFTSLRNWILNGRPKINAQGQTAAKNESGERRLTLRYLWQRARHLFNPQNPVSQLFFLFIFANILFMNFYFAIPLQFLLALQLGMGALLLINWLFLFKNVQVSQKVKLISLTGILPATCISIVQATILLLSFASAVFAQYVPQGIYQALLNFQMPVHWGELAGFVAMMYSLLGFSSIMKDQTKFEQASAPSEERRLIIQEMILRRLEQAAPQLREKLTTAEIAALRQPIKIRLFSNAGLPEWLKEFSRSGLHVYKENVYLRRRIFNLLNDQTMADLIFQKILKRKLPMETAESLAGAVTGRDVQQDEMLLTSILQGGSAREMDLAITLMNFQKNVSSGLDRAALQRSALEKRFQVKFPVAENTYTREFSGSWVLLNQKMRIIEHFQMPPHPFLLCLSLERLQKLGRLLAASYRKQTIDGTLCRKIIETGELDAQTGLFAQWGMRLTQTLPVSIRQRWEWHWLRTCPTAYLRLLLSDDRSALADRLRDRRTPAGQTFTAWASFPDGNAPREWIRQLLKALDQSSGTERERADSLRTISRLSRQLASLEGKNCGMWITEPYARQILWMPRLLLEPDSGGLRGALADSLDDLPVKFNFPIPRAPRHPRAHLLERMA